MVSDVNTPNPDKKSIMMYLMCLFQSLPHAPEDVADLDSLASEPAENSEHAEHAEHSEHAEHAEHAELADADNDVTISLLSVLRRHHNIRKCTVVIVSVVTIQFDDKCTILQPSTKRRE